MATATDDVNTRMLARKALKAAKRLAERHRDVDLDAAESVALAAALEAKRRWEADRASIGTFGEMVIGDRLRDALRRGHLYGDAAARRFGAVSIDDLGEDGSEPSYCVDAIGESVDEVIAVLGLSADDERLLRERLDGDRQQSGRADGRSENEVKVSLRRIRRRIDAHLQGGAAC